MDPLSDVLALLQPDSYTFGGLDAGGSWALDFPADEGIKCYAPIEGDLLLTVEGLPGPIHARAGEFILLPRGRPFRLASDPDAVPIDAYAFLTEPLDGRVAILNGGGDFFGLGGFFTFAGHHAAILLEILPPVIHLSGAADRAALAWLLDRLMRELRDPQPGGALLARHAAQMILVLGLRLHLARTPRGIGWLFALADPRLAAALTAMHADPAHPWTLASLAARAGMSRSTFALRFRQRVGAAPLDYLTRWRMLLAADRLRATRDPISVIAPALGYESDSAFGAAFKRVMGRSPRDYASPRSPSPAHQAA